MNKAAWQDRKILIIDDEPANTLLLERLFEMVGIGICRCTNDSREAMAAYHEWQPDLVLLDLSMPYIDGFAVLEQLRGAVEPTDYLPIIVLTADATEQAKERALSGGANDFLTKPFSNAEVVLRVRSLLETRRLHRETRLHSEKLEAVVQERTSLLRRALEDLQTAQQQVIQQERLRALGTMASGVAHDFNNALSIILGFGEFVLRECQDAAGMEKAAEQMRVIITTAEDAAKTVRRLRAFHHTEESEADRCVDLNALVEQALTLTEPRWKTQTRARGVEIRTKLEFGDNPQIMGQPHELREVLTNLIFNAVDAMPDGGTLTLRTTAGDDAVLLSISDTGTGMSEEVRQRCLEPFFSTKGERGSGLGLSMVYGTIQRHRGEMDIQSEIGQGTTFQLRFAPAGEAAKAADGQALAAVDRPLRILIVDDQEIIREILEMYLTSDLHAVVAAEDGEAALAEISRQTFDLVITDQAMPGMSGEQLASAAKKAGCPARTILLTGFGGGDEPRASHIDLVVGKPVSQAGLRKAIATVMADQS